jgi:hypothetical protein
VILIARLVGRFYVSLHSGTASVVLRGGNHLFEAVRRAQEGKSRLIIAFRHPNGWEPQITTLFFLFKLRRLAAKNGVRFTRRAHATFLYTYEVARWGGWLFRFVMSGLGALPVYKSKVDAGSMAEIIKAIVDGSYPLALAPEGMVTYSASTVTHLEHGTARMGFRAAQLLHKREPDCPVEIIPLSYHFRYGAPGRITFAMLLRKTERVCGFSGREDPQLTFSQRAARCRDHILAVNEKRYRTESGSADEGGASLSFEQRLDRVVNRAMEAAERTIGVKPADGADIFSRMHHVNQACWDRIFIPGVKSFRGRSQVERSSADIQAGEAWYARRHTELVDLCWFFKSAAVPEEDSAFHEKAEYMQNLWDFASRTMGGAYKNRRNILHKKVIMQAAPVINLSERLPAYIENKKAASMAVMQDLEKSYLDCIDAAESSESRSCENRHLRKRRNHE